VSPRKITVEIDGETLSLKDVARRAGVAHRNIYNRYQHLMAGKMTKEEFVAPGRSRHVTDRWPVNLEMVYAVEHLPMNALRAVDDEDGEIREDYFTWYVTHVHPDGLTLDQISELLGVGKERVRQIEEAALRKFAINAREMGLDVREMVHALGAERDERDEVLD